MKKVSGHTHTQSQLDDFANVNNFYSDAHTAAVINRTNQLNPFNDAYWESRGLPPPDYSQLALKMAKEK